MKIFVGNLPFSMTDDALAELFAPHGEVESAKVVTDRDTGRSRGFGFVEMPDESARKAIDALNNQDVGGRPLTVNEAKPKAPGGGGGGGGRGGRGGRDRY
jgi:RNA recognition motif-containing protein